MQLRDEIKEINRKYNKASKLHLRIAEKNNGAQLNGNVKASFKSCYKLSLESLGGLNQVSHNCFLAFAACVWFARSHCVLAFCMFSCFSYPKSVTKATSAETRRGELRRIASTQNFLFTIKCDTISTLFRTLFWKMTSIWMRDKPAKRNRFARIPRSIAGDSRGFFLPFKKKSPKRLCDK